MFKKKPDILNGPILQSLLQLMLPILFAGVFQQLYGMADALVLGAYVGDNAVAIVGGSTRTLIRLVESVCINLQLGCLVVIAYFIGSRNYEKLLASIKTSVMILGIFALAFTGLYFAGSDLFLRVMKVPEELMVSSASFLRLYSLGFLPYALFQLSISILRGFGETKTPTYLLIFSYIFCIVLDYLFVGVFHLEQYGIAIAFILSQLVAALVALYIVTQITHIDLFRQKADKECYGRILKIGIPSAFSGVAFSLTTMMVQSGINMLGPNRITAYAVYYKMENILWVFMDGLGVAFATLCGQNYGAKQYDRVKRIVRVSMAFGLAVTIGISAVMILARYPIARLFSEDLATINIIAKMFKYQCKFYFLYVFIEIYQGFLKCVSKTFESTIIIFVSVIVIRILWALFIMFPHLSFTNCMACFVVSWAVAAVMFAVDYYRLLRKGIENIQA